MDPFRRYPNSSRIYGKLSKTYENIFIQRFGDTFYVRKLGNIPEQGAFISYNYSTKDFMEALYVIIEKNLFEFYVSPNIDLESTLNFILSSEVNVTILPYFTEVFPNYHFTSFPIVYDAEKFEMPERTEKIQFLFPRVFVGQEVFIGEKLKLISKASSSAETDTELFGTRQSKLINSIKDKLLSLKLRLSELKERNAEIDTLIELNIRELAETSKIIELDIDKINDIKLSYNEKFLLEKSKIEEKWNKVYENYNNRRIQKIASIDDEISQTDNQERIKNLNERKKKLEKELEQGHARNKHEDEINEIDERLKREMTELDLSLEIKSKDLIDKSFSLNERIQDNYLEKESNSSKMKTIIDLIEELEVEKEKLVAEIAIEREKFSETI